MFNFTIYLEVKNNIYSFIIICFKLIKNIVDILKFNFLIFFFFLNLLVLEPKLDSSISPDIWIVLLCYLKLIFKSLASIDFYCYSASFSASF